MEQVIEKLLIGSFLAALAGMGAFAYYFSRRHRQRPVFVVFCSLCFFLLLFVIVFNVILVALAGS